MSQKLRLMVNKCRIKKLQVFIAKNHRMALKNMVSKRLRFTNQQPSFSSYATMTNFQAKMTNLIILMQPEQESSLWRVNSIEFLELYED